MKSPILILPIWTFLDDSSYDANLGVRNLDVSGTRLEKCHELYVEPSCLDESPYRNTDGSCNNLGRSVTNQGQTSVSTSV